MEATFSKTKNINKMRDTSKLVNYIINNQNWQNDIT